MHINFYAPSFSYKGGIYINITEKERKIKAEISRFKKLFKNIEKDKHSFAEKLYTQAAFMVVTLNELQETIKKEGAIIFVTNGNGFKVKQENPAQKSYNTMIKNYNATVKALGDLFDDTCNKSEKDELLEFINKP